MRAFLPKNLAQHARWKTQGLLWALLLAGHSIDAQAADTLQPARKAALAAGSAREGKTLWMTVGKRRFAVTLADNDTARELIKRIPLTLQMAELNGNEKHAELAQPLPTHEENPGSIEVGDIMLYGNDTVVVFYAAFKTSYRYTPLGRVTDPQGLAQALGRNAARIEFSAN